LKSVGAQAVEQGDVLPPDAAQLKLCEDDGEQPVVGRGAGDVRVDNDDCHARSEPVPQRRAADRVAEGLPDGGGFIRQRRSVLREENVSIVGEVQVQAVAAVVHCEVHDKGIIKQIKCGER